MTCEHLIQLEKSLLAQGVKEASRGQAWSKDCREWVYFTVYFDLPAVRTQFKLDACVEIHEHRGTHDGEEAGFYCSIHHDGIMGRLRATPGVPNFP